MNILFLSYDAISLDQGLVRSVAMLYALADAGHTVDLLAPHCDLPDHPHIRVLLDHRSKPACRLRVRSTGIRAMARGNYAVVHAIGDVVFHALDLCRWKKARLVYAATASSIGGSGTGASGLGRLFPGYVAWREARVLDKAAVVFSPCEVLTTDIGRLKQDVRCVQLEDIPAQSLHSMRYAKESDALSTSRKRAGYTVLCSALPGHGIDLRTLFMAVRKVIESQSDTTFFFRGISRQKAEKIVASLDMKERCFFLPENEPIPFLSALESADAILMLPPAADRCCHEQVYTLLHAGAPIVTVHHTAYDHLLTDRTSVRVMPNSESISEGLLRTMQEPLFSLAIAMEGQQLIVGRHTYSSFKHKVRMTYHDLAKPR
jgi:hypothetical protein